MEKDTLEALAAIVERLARIEKKVDHVLRVSKRLALEVMPQHAVNKL